MSQARRRFGRFERELVVEIGFGDHSYNARTTDIGLGGVSINTSLCPDFGTVLELRISVPQPLQVVEASGKVMWVKPGSPNSVGLAFEALRPIDVWALLQYFNLSSKEEGGPS